MKKLLNTLYVTSPDRYLTLDGENVAVRSGDEEIGRLPLHNLESIITFGHAGASPGLMFACAERDITLCFMSRSGRFLARVCGEVRGNVFLRREQFRLADDEAASLRIARGFLTGKLFNSKWVIERAIRDYPLRLDAEKLKSRSRLLDAAIKGLETAESAEALRGIEGEAAAAYFAVFDDLILQQKDGFFFEGRSRRPPMDNVNAMLSFAYSLLAGMCASALESAGLDPYVGFLHTDRPGRISLALDMMEELRSVFADRFVLTLINKKIVSESGFVRRENGAVSMDDDTRRAFLAAWQDRKQDEITHPFLGEKMEWGLVPQVQALLLARFIRGDLDAYPIFLWK